MTRRLFFLLLGLLLGLPAAWAEGDEPLTIINFNGHGQPFAQSFSGAPRRVITTNGSTTEMMLRLGLAEHIIGTAYQDNPVAPDLAEAYAGLPVLSRRYPGREQVLALEPDLIYGWSSIFTPQILGDVGYWRKLGVNAFIARNSILKPQRVYHFYDDLADLGRIFQVEERAQAIAAASRREIETIRARSAAGPVKPRAALVEAFQGGGGLRALGPDSLAGDMLALVGGQNVFPSSGLYTLEALIEADPDVIILVYMDQNQGEAERLLNRFRDHPVLGKLQAVGRGRLQVIPLAETYCAGVRINQGLRRLAAGLYPGVFHDFEF